MFIESMRSAAAGFFVPDKLTTGAICVVTGFFVLEGIKKVQRQATTEEKKQELINFVFPALLAGALTYLGVKRMGSPLTPLRVALMMGSGALMFASGLVLAGKEAPPWTINTAWTAVFTTFASAAISAVALASKKFGFSQ